MAKRATKPTAEKKPPAADGIVRTFALVGNDAYLVREAMQQVMASLPEQPQRSDFEGDSAKLSDVLDELRSVSMFGGLRLVIVREGSDFLTKHRAAVEDYVASPSEQAVLVLRLDSLPANQRIYKLIQANGKILDCTAPEGRALPGWVQKLAKANGVQLDLNATQTIVDYIGGDLGRIDNELAKLALEHSGTIGEAEVAASVSFQREQNLRELLSQLDRGRIQEAVGMWRQMTQTDPAAQFKVVAWLAPWLDKLVRVLSMQSQGIGNGEIAKALRLWRPDQVEPLAQTAKSLGPRRLRAAVDRLADVDRRNKSSLGDPAQNIEQFLISLAAR